MEFGVKIEINLNDLEHVSELVTGLADFDPSELVAQIASTGETQTRNRVINGGPGPDGEAWPPNLEGSPTLHRSGDNLRAQIAFKAHGSEAEWGCAWPLAHVHQFGAIIKAKDAERLSFVLRGRRVFAKTVVIPARPFVGVSDEDAKEIESIVTDFLGALL